MSNGMVIIFQLEFGLIIKISLYENELFCTL